MASQKERLTWEPGDIEIEFPEDEKTRATGSIEDRAKQRNPETTRRLRSLHHSETGSH